jgi:hypothetical protein
MQNEIFILSINGRVISANFELLPVFGAYSKKVGEGEETISYQGVAKAMKSKKTPGVSHFYQNDLFFCFQRVALDSRKPFKFLPNAATDLPSAD